MEQQYQWIGEKPKTVFVKHGQEYTRKGYDIKIDSAKKFSKKCDMMGFSETKVVELLIEAFNNSSGWGPNVKNGLYFETNPHLHVQDAVAQFSKNY